jgi:ABC-type branched-subunit amino acid transport system ATPase component
VNEPPILGFAGVSAGYGKLTVLDRIDLALGREEVLAVLGANGSGKSTVLKTAIGLTRMSAGRVRFAGQDIGDLPPHRRAALGIGYVPQTRNVFADLSVIDNLRMGGFARRDPIGDDLEDVFALFPRLRERRRVRAGTLSGGERRMLSIGLTLLMRPKLLLLDEPSSDLAPATVAQVFEAIGRIRAERKIPVLLVEQNVRAALALADRVCVLVRGRVALDVPAAQVDLSHLHSLFLDGGVRAA